MNYKLPADSEKAVYVERKFDEIAQVYDRFNDCITFGMHRYWKRFVACQTGLRAGEHCLDICCGTGDIARAVKRMHPECRVTALDFSREMLKLAGGHRDAKSNPVCYLRGDAMKLPFHQDGFEAVTVGYGLRNVPDLKACLREILRVLKPGGVLVSLDVGRTRLPLLSDLIRYYFFSIVPWIGRKLMPGQEMFTYLPFSSLEYPDQETLKRLMLESGFQQVDVHDFVFGASTVHVAFKPVRH